MQARQIFSFLSLLLSLLVFFFFNLLFPPFQWRYLHLPFFLSRAKLFFAHFPYHRHELLNSSHVPPPSLQTTVWLTSCAARPENTKDKGKNRLDIDYRLTPADLSEEDTAITSTVIPATSTSSVTRRKSLPRIVTVANPFAKATLSAPDSPSVKPTQWQVVQAKRKTRGELSLTSPVYPPEVTNLAAEQRAAARRLRARGGHYRAAALVVAERAREQAEIARAAESHNYDIMVDQNSTSNQIDLHGLPVVDGVRIALERTQRWWSNLGENRVRRAKEDVFTIVTGLGNHNSGGVSPLRQEVGAALRRAGWRFATGTGQYFISGKV